MNEAVDLGFITHLGTFPPAAHCTHMVSLLVGLIVLFLIVGCLIYCVRLLPIPAPFNNVVVVLIILIAIVILVDRAGLLTGARL